MVVAGHSGALAAKAGFQLPILSYALQAMVSEPIKPVLNTVVMSPTTAAYVSQSDKGELVFGAGLDLYPSYAQRGNLTSRRPSSPACWNFPRVSAAQADAPMGRHRRCAWDYSPILGPSPIEGLYLNCGWGTGGFKAMPAGGYVLAHMHGNRRHHPISSAVRPVPLRNRRIDRRSRRRRDLALMANLC